MLLARKYFILLHLLFLFPMVCNSNSAVPDPTEQLKPFLEKITGIIASGNTGVDSKCELCQRVIDVARERFDFEEMSKRVLGSQWKKLSLEQRSNFTDLFTRLLQHAYIGKVDQYAGQRVEYVKQRVKGKRAEVKTLLVDKEKSIPVSYIMILREDQWMVYDVVVEGVSLVRNYMEQFREILRKDDFAGLVKMIEEKIDTIEATKTPK